MSGSKTSVKIKSPKNKSTIFGLPSKSYTDNEFWEKECNTALSDGWLFVAFVHEFSKVGDVVPIFIAGKPILLVKNENNIITAFHNVCSHRCLKLVNESILLISVNSSKVKLLIFSELIDSDFSFLVIIEEKCLTFLNSLDTTCVELILIIKYSHPKLRKFKIRALHTNFRAQHQICLSCRLS